MFTDELWDLLVTKTNRYARQKGVTNSNDSTREEMYCFVSL